MNKGKPTNLAASVHQRLFNKADSTKRPFNEVFQYYAMERFLYRLSKSKYRDKFVLKGALMLKAWQVAKHRSTMDIDLLGRLETNMTELKTILTEVCSQEVEDDGLKFSADDLKIDLIAENTEYGGMRAVFQANLGNARVKMQTDIGFGFKVFPEPQLIDYPVILDFPHPRLFGYPIETSISEKFHAMVDKGLLNSRMKDFYDIWTISRQFSFHGPTIAKAISTTFSKRETSLKDLPIAFTDEFATSISKNAQWTAFLRKTRAEDAPQGLAEVIADISAFLEPIRKAILDSTEFKLIWEPPGPWK